MVIGWQVKISAIISHTFTVIKLKAFIVECSLNHDEYETLQILTCSFIMQYLLYKKRPKLL
jgi:hypothetical protein